MEGERPFSFKLWVPPRNSLGQVSAVKPQEMVDDSCAFKQPPQPPQAFHKKPTGMESNMQFPALTKVVSSKPTRQDTAKKMAVLPMEKEETPLRSSQLYSKLFEEAEKIKCWKVKMDAEVCQKDRKLADNKRTIEKQQKTIHELQFENESLSMKLEKEMNKNTDLQNKINSTRSICTLLQETIKRSEENMLLFESEREETHHLFLQNSENIQRMSRSFEELCDKAEAGRHDLLKLKDELKECNEVKERCQTEYRIKHQEVTVLHAKLSEKEGELQDILQALRVAQMNCDQLQEAANRNQKILEESKQERQVLLDQLHKAELANQESEECRKAIETTLAENRAQLTKALAEKVHCVEELEKNLNEQAIKHQGILATGEELQVKLTLEMQKVKELGEALGAVTEELKLKTSELEQLKMEETKVLQLTQELESKNSEIQQLMSKLCGIEEQLSVALVNERTSVEEIQRLKGDIELCKIEYEQLTASFAELQHQKEALSLQAQVREDHVKTLEAHLKEREDNEKRIKQEMGKAEEKKRQLRDELESLKASMDEQGRETETMSKRQEDSSKTLQNELTRKEKQMKALEVKINALKARIETKTKVHEDCVKENKDLEKQVATVNEECSKLESKVKELKGELESAAVHHSEELKGAVETHRSSEAELQEKLERLQLSAAVAVRSKEETELTCQHKITEMVALMDKHKSQYDKMLGEKDAELDEKRKKEAQIQAEKQALELEMSKLKVQNLDLKKKLENETKEKENMKHEVSTLNKKMKSLKEDIKARKRHPLTPVKKSNSLKDTASPKSSTNSRQDIFDFINDQENEGCENETVQRKAMVTPQLKRTLQKELPTAVTPALSVSSTPAQKLKPVDFAAKVSESGTVKALWSSGNKAVVTPRIKSYRIRTPPSPGKSKLLGRSTMELDPKSDSSELNESLSFSVPSGPLKRRLNPVDSGPLRQQGNLHKRLESPVDFRSPATALKLAAVKRLRDMNWIAVTNSDKRKKKALGKIFE
ncbi:hypothetical protein GJAV_G00182020 [Gymnothorax javanicus]|nr:hypothetical protein GJAV_G00182020 [Gymnothorax javanicus]